MPLPLPIIEAYTFGKMQINGRMYTSDLIIYPDGKIADSWWRAQGHVLEINDIKALVQTAPDLIIAGTGDSGLMRPAPALEKQLAARSIRLIIQPTAQAKDTYNDMKDTHRLGACFHLTC